MVFREDTPITYRVVAISQDGRWAFCAASSTFAVIPLGVADLGDQPWGTHAPQNLYAHVLRTLRRNALLCEFRRGAG